MKILPTKYNGYQFRSRTEARWAFFFDEIYVPYEYEKEGFLLDNGQCYLPDFYLPTVKAWVEIKGGIPTYEEHEKCRQLSFGTKSTVVLISGIPDPNTSSFFVFHCGVPQPAKSCRYLSNFLSELLEANASGNKDAILQVARLNTLCNEYEGDEYAYGQAKAARFGDIA